jgi:hypothetical protein
MFLLAAHDATCSPLHAVVASDGAVALLEVGFGRDAAGRPEPHVDAYMSGAVNAMTDETGESRDAYGLGDTLAEAVYALALGDARCVGDYVQATAAKLRAPADAVWSRAIARLLPAVLELREQLLDAPPAPLGGRIADVGAEHAPQMYALAWRLAALLTDDRVTHDFACVAGSRVCHGGVHWSRLHVRAIDPSRALGADGRFRDAARHMAGLALPALADRLAMPLPQP